jgi:dGTPase
LGMDIENEATLSERARRWAGTMQGHGSSIEGIRQAHGGGAMGVGEFSIFDREAREAAQNEVLAPGATRSFGSGNRPGLEEPDPWRTCFERDRDRVLHKATAFRRLAGKTQVFVFPEDHQRTRLTHALEVAQIAQAIAAALRLNVALAEAIALAHDCGHGPFGHASEDALDPFIAGGFDHAPWGADVTLAPLNLTKEVSDGIRNHSWSRPAPSTPEGEVCALADRIAYTTHDAEDAGRAGVVDLSELPKSVIEQAGATRSRQLDAFIKDVVVTTQGFGVIGMSEPMADTLAALRAWNYERIYLRPDSIRQANMVHHLLAALVEHYLENQSALPPRSDATSKEHVGLNLTPTHRAVTYVAGMTDRFACIQATRLLEWPRTQLPEGFDVSFLN